MGTAAGVAMWVKNLTPIGLLMRVVGIAVNMAYEKGMELFGEDISAAERRFSDYLLSIANDLNKEQSDILVSTAIKFMKEAGRMGIQWGASKGVNRVMKGWSGKGSKAGGGKIPNKEAKSAYDTAKEGGKHKGMYKESLRLNNKQLQKAIRSFEKKVEIHENLVKDPVRYLEEYGKDIEGPWHTLSLERRQALLEKKWPNEIKNFKEQIAIIKEILNSRK